MDRYVKLRTVAVRKIMAVLARTKWERNRGARLGSKGLERLGEEERGGAWQ